MLEWVAVISGILTGILRWLEGRLERARSAVDSSLDRARLRRAGARVREWLRANRARVGGKSDQDGATDHGQDLRPR